MCLQVDHTVSRMGVVYKGPFYDVMAAAGGATN